LSRGAQPVLGMSHKENHRDRSGDGLFLGGHFKAR
jgi:hypothetical protein